LESIAETYPEVWLVDGQCALALGDPAGGLALGRRYLDRAPKGTAAGHALVGEAQAARGNLAEARKELERARELEPERRRWTVRYAVVLRRANEHAGALEALERIGPPAQPAIDPDWWLELGEILLAKCEAQAVVSRIGPVVGELAGDAPIRVVLGAAQLATGQAEIAVKTLSEAEELASSPRSKQLLSDALTSVAVGKLAAGDAASAEPLLARADALDGDAVVWRNLGIARLALDRPKDAVAVLDRAAKADGAPITTMLAARARALGGDVAGARPLYERALAGEKDQPIEVAIDWAASELAGGDPSVAVAALEKVAGQAKSGPLAQRHKAALAEARHAAGVAALRSGAGGRAVELLRASAAADPSLATRCDLALGTVVAGEATQALAALRAVSGQSCPFPPPADTQAAPILIAFTEGLSARRAGKALDRLTALAGKSSGAAAVLLGTAMRVVALEAARDAYNAGQLAQLRRHLATAKRANARVGNDEVAHNLAVVDLLDNRLDSAIAQLDRLASKLPEAYVNLGIAYERKGEPEKALEAWRRARKAGVRYAPLAEWIEAKERIYGEAP
ncbi:MAG: tetratricopeptide repeat protein, partial [Kofleriaceae bacterium]